MADAETASQDLTVSYEWTDASGTVLDSTDADTTSLNAGDVVTCTVTRRWQYARSGQCQHNIGWK